MSSSEKLKQEHGDDSRPRFEGQPIFKGDFRENKKEKNGEDPDN